MTVSAQSGQTGKTKMMGRWADRHLQALLDSDSGGVDVKQYVILRWRRQQKESIAPALIRGAK